MGEELRYQERWDFRRNEGDLHSSSDDSNKPDSQKHKLVSSFISNENDETSEHAPKMPAQKTVQDHLAAARSTKSKKKEPGSNKKRKIVNKDVPNQVKTGQGESFRKVGRKKSKKAAAEPPAASMDSLKVFMESLFKDFQVAREEMLVWMREEMHAVRGNTAARKDTSNTPQMTKTQNNCGSGLQLLADHTTHLSNVGSGSKGGKSNNESLAQLKKSQKVNDSSKYPYRAENQEVELVHISDSDQSPHQTNVGARQDKCNGGFLAQSLKAQKVADSNHANRDSDQTRRQTKAGSGLNCNGGFLAHSSKSQSVANSNHQYRVAEKQVEPDHLASSMYMTLPSVMHELGVKPQKISSSPYGQAHPGLSAANNPSQHVVHEPGVKPNKVSSSPYNLHAHPGLTAANTEPVTLPPHKPTQGQYFMGMQKEQRGGQNVNSSDQNTPMSFSIGSGFSLPPHQGLDRRFTSPNQVGAENRHTNVLGSKMDGGSLNFSQGNMDYFSRLMAYQNQNTKAGNLFPS